MDNHEKQEITIEQILDATYDGIAAIDKKGKIILFNKAAKRIFGVESVKCEGEHINDVTPNAKMPEVVDTKKADVNAVVDISDALTVITSRMPIFDKEGKVAGAVAVFKDVPQLQVLSTEVSRLEEMQCMLKAIFYAAQDAISVVNQDGTVVMVNRAYEKLLGYDQSEIVGKPCEADVTAGESVHRAVLADGKEQRGFPMKIGKFQRDIIADGAPILVNGKLAGSVVVARDVTEIKNLARELEKTKKALRNMEGKYTFNDIVGKNPQFVNVIEKAKIVAKTPATILLEGESGTGKELFAHAIHNESRRKNRPFIRVNCAAISESLLESELFGYEDGAFTGAKKSGKAGYFEQANEGTLFLDEVSKMSLALQGKLLRVLQEKELTRVGAVKPISIDARIVAAANINLEDEIKAGRFREDLYYRLSMIPIKIPPLRERKDDLKLLSEHIITLFNNEYGRQIRCISEEALEVMRSKRWRGNVRELRNYLSRTIIYMDEGEFYIEKRHLPENVEDRENGCFVADLAQRSSLAEEDDKKSPTLAAVVEAAEKQYIIRVLEKNGGNKTKAAAELGIAIRSLYNKLEILDIPK